MTELHKQPLVSQTLAGIGVFSRVELRIVRFDRYSGPGWANRERARKMVEDILMGLK